MQVNVARRSASREGGPPFFESFGWQASFHSMKGPPFDQLKNIQLLSGHRRGQGSVEHARHQLYIARDKQTSEGVLVKVTSKPGLVYEHNLLNEIASLSTINRELPDSPYFPVIRGHGRQPDGRIYLLTSLFDEFPLATTIGPEPIPAKTVAHIRIALEAAKALAQLHRLEIFHVDLNPMNILHRVEKGAPVIRIVDFESSYEVARHMKGVFYSPPTTPGYSAPEVPGQPPDARADVFSLAAVLYTMLAGYARTWGVETATAVDGDPDLDSDLKAILLKALDGDPAARYPSIEEFYAALAAYLEAIWPGRSW
jgi:serine/threonine protein kinase